MRLEAFAINLLLSAPQSQSYVTVKKSFVNPPMIFFSGTQNITDLLVDDFLFDPICWPTKKNSKHYVHGGFGRRARRLLDLLDDFVEENDDFVIGGHSLGGACAILCASYIQDEKHKNIKKIFTFGVPRLASKKFQQYYKSQKLWHKTTNYIIAKDPVTRLPIYKFVGNIVLFKGYECDNLLEHHDLKSYLDVINQLDD